MITFDPNRPMFADVNRWHPMLDIREYIKNCPAKCIGMKISEGNFIAQHAMAYLQTFEQHGLIVIGYNYGLSNQVFMNAFPPKPGRIHCLDFDGNSLSV